MSKREKLFAKIKAMLAMTVENGCTESEAMAALALARKWMDEHNVSDTDLAFDGEKARVHSEPKDDRDEIRSRLCLAVAAFCGCNAFKNGFDRIAFVGLYSDTTFAFWLLDMLDSFVKRELDRFLAENPRRQRVRKLETRGFVSGCAGRIAQRLYELAGPSTDLTVKKNALITEAMAQAGIKLRDRFSLKRRDESATLAGMEAGDRAQFNKPVGQAQGVRLLGGTDAGTNT